LGKGNKERIVPITNEDTIKAIKNYYTVFKSEIDRNEYFFINRLNNKLSEQSVRYLIKKICLASGITRNITPHVFRHTFATLLLEANINIRYIQELLGHSSINITQIYTHVSNKRTFEILQLKHPRNKIICN
jgi:site-specific recombinase XerD